MSKKLATAVLSAVLGLITTTSCGAQTSPYAGDQKREIKALSAEETAGYLEGKGMGLAKAAELNHYPGPAHVLTLANELGLTPDQRVRTETLFKTMEREAITLGKQLIERERELDDMFAGRTITGEKLKEALEAIAVLQGKLRQVHLQTHLAQAEILDDGQIRKYDELRGYAQTANSTHHLHPHQH